MKIILLCLLFFLNACTATESAPTETAIELSDKNIIDVQHDNLTTVSEYDRSVWHQLDELTQRSIVQADDALLQSFSELMPKINQMNNEDERYKATLQVYNITAPDKIIPFIEQETKDRPDHWMVVFKCGLLEMSDNDVEQTQAKTCYQAYTSWANQEIINKGYTEQSNPKEMFGYYILNIKAGDDSYHQKIKTLLASLPDGEQKTSLTHTYESWYAIP